MLTNIKTKAIHLLRGQNAEDQAYDFLLNQGLTLIIRNFRCTQGEIDLIMQDNYALIFVEVRFRMNNKYGSPAESITKTKQNRIITTAQVFLSSIKAKDHPIRFDVIAISGNGTIDWIKNAF